MLAEREWEEEEDSGCGPGIEVVFQGSGYLIIRGHSWTTGSSKSSQEMFYIW